MLSTEFLKILSNGGSARFDTDARVAGAVTIKGLAPRRGAHDVMIENATFDGLVTVTGSNVHRSISLRNCRFLGGLAFEGCFCAGGQLVISGPTRNHMTIKSLSFSNSQFNCVGIDNVGIGSILDLSGLDLMDCFVMTDVDVSELKVAGIDREKFASTSFKAKAAYTDDVILAAQLMSVGVRTPLTTMMASRFFQSPAVALLKSCAA